MSFRVWFSRMVWIVAAAVALSGCGDDKKKEDKNTETEPGGEVEDGLAIAISPAAPKAGEKVTITVTVTGEIDGKVNIAVTDCGDGDLAAADHDVTAGKAAVDIPAAKTAKTDTKKCKITAKAKIGDEDMTETHEFAVAEEGTGGATDLALVLAIKPGPGDMAATATEKAQVKKSSAGDTDFTVTATITKDGSPATAADLSGYTLKINWSCDGAEGTAVSYTNWTASVSGDHQLGAHDAALDNCKLTGELDHSTDTKDKSAADVSFKFIN